MAENKVSNIPVMKIYGGFHGKYNEQFRKTISVYMEEK